MSCILLYRPLPSEEAPELSLPLFEGRVRCGMSRFPSPAEAFALKELDLNKKLITNAPSTVLAYAGDNSMIDVGIHHGDLLIIDKSLPYKSGAICVICYYGEFICKRLYDDESGRRWLVSENKAEAARYPRILVEEEESEAVFVFGVMKYVIHQPE